MPIAVSLETSGSAGRGVAPSVRLWIGYAFRFTIARTLPVPRIDTIDERSALVVSCGRRKQLGPPETAGENPFVRKPSSLIVPPVCCEMICVLLVPDQWGDVGKRHRECVHHSR